MTKIVKVKKAKSGELYLQFTRKLLKELNWKTGDKIEWIANQDGSFTLKKE